MAYNFLGLVNEVNARLNEVQLDSSNFASAGGFYQQAKDAVNAAIRDINQSEFEWPFNHVEQQDVLTPNVARYGFPAYAKTINFNTFRIKEDATLGNGTQSLIPRMYEEYMDSMIKQEYSSSTDDTGIPRYIIRAPSLEYVVYPKPDKAYTLVYEYFTDPVSLVNHDDVPTIPEQYGYIIIEGAMYHAYMFRSNVQAAGMAKTRLDEGIKSMKTLLINRFEQVRSTVIAENTNQGIYKFSGGII